MDTITRQLDQRRKNSMASFEHLMHFLNGIFQQLLDSNHMDMNPTVPSLFSGCLDVTVSVGFLGPLFTFSHLATILSIYLCFLLENCRGSPVSTVKHKACSTRKTHLLFRSLSFKIRKALVVSGVVSHVIASPKNALSTQ